MRVFGKFSRGAEGAAKNCTFCQIYRRYWGWGGQTPILPPLTRHWGGHLPPPPPTCVSVPPLKNVRPQNCVQTTSFKGVAAFLKGYNLSYGACFVKKVWLTFPNLGYREPNFETVPVFIFVRLG